MVGVTESILIDHPADDLFAFVANYENDPIYGFFHLLSPLIVWMFRRRVKADLARLQRMLERDA